MASHHVSTCESSGMSGNIGGNVNDQLISLKRDREREGRCSECGAQTHEFRTDPISGQRVKEPLSVEGEVHRGRCLLCHPLPHAVPGSDSWPPSNSTNNSPHSNTGIATPPTSTSPFSSLHHGPVTSVGALGGRFSLMQTTRQWNSCRSVNTSSSAGANSSGANSVRSEPASFARHHPDNVESSSVVTAATDSVTSRTATAAASVSTSAAESAQDVENALAALDSETYDLCDIISTMRGFPNHVAVQELGCERLWIQSWDDETSSAIGRVGGIPTILDAMRGHIHSPHLQQCGCEALRNLALNEFNREVISEQGGIVVIVDAMRRHWDVSGVQQCGCTAVANIAGDSVDNKVAIVECGGVHAILKSVETFPEDEAVLRSAYQALRVLGYNPTAAVQDAMRQQGGNGDDGTGDTVMTDSLTGEIASAGDDAGGRR